MAQHLNITINTVRSAYKRLEDEGIVETRQGLGTRVIPYNHLRVVQKARSLPSHTIGVILPTISNPFYQEFLDGVEEMSFSSHDLIYLCQTHDDPSEFARYLAQLSARQVDGIIVVQHNLLRLFPPDTGEEELKRLAIPLVSVDWASNPGYSALLDLENAGYLATRHLLEHGHRRVGLITYHSEVTNVRPLHLGYERALDEAGLRLDPELVARVNRFDIPSGALGMRELLARARRPTAVFAICDPMALGALGEIKAAGLRVPQDIALAGFNDFPLAELIDPPLTTVAAPARELGVEAIKMLQDLIAGKRPVRERVVLPVHLVLRKSCGCDFDSGIK